MKDELITYETAVLARDKGFDLPVDFCFRKFHNDVSEIYEVDENFNGTDWNNGLNLNEEFFSKPTQSLLQRWLREKHKLHIELFLTSDGYWTVRNIVKICDADIGIRDSEFYPTYEQALEEGLQIALKLINLKEKNDESTSTTKSTDKEDSKISSKPRHPHFPPGEAEWL
jgi:hypothetical protein